MGKNKREFEITGLYGTVGYLPESALEFMRCMCGGKLKQDGLEKSEYTRRESRGYLCLKCNGRYGARERLKYERRRSIRFK